MGAVGPIAVGPIAVGPIAVGPIAVGPIAVGPIVRATARRFNELQPICGVLRSL